MILTVLSVETETDIVITVECNADDTVAVLKNKVTAQTGMPVGVQVLSFRNRVLHDNETVLSIGAVDHDLLMLQLKAVQEDMGHPMLNSLDFEGQKKIEEIIKQKNIDENLRQAMEYTPEVFGSVSMLYVNMEVNGVAVQAFVDSGAQMTIMTQEFAEKCSLTRLIDQRFAGVALGVGQSKILGRVHQAPLKVQDRYVASSLVVLEQKSGPPFIFGLDNLIRHECNIDLKAMKLVFGSIGVEVPFLPEHLIGRSNNHVLEQDGVGASQSSVPSKQPLAEEFPEEKIERLLALGFSRQRCIEALRAAHGNEEAAAALLFGPF